MNIAAQEGVSMRNWKTLAEQGNEGRVTKKDILQYVQDKKTEKTSESRLSTTIEPAADGNSHEPRRGSATHTEEYTNQLLQRQC